MASPGNPHLQNFSGNFQKREVGILTQAVEKVFRKLIRLLIGRMSLKKLQKLIQIIFVEESENKLGQNTPGKNATLADLALLTGMDIRTIKKTKAYIDRGNSVHQDDTFLEGFMPMFKVLDLWMNDERFYDAHFKKPRELKIDGEEVTFSQLVKLTLQSRGLSAQLVLKRLKEAGVISVNSLDGTVKLIQQDNIFISEDELSSIEVGFAAIGNLADTVCHNIQSSLNKDTKYFQRGCWNYQFSPEKIHQVRKLIHNFLKKTDGKSRELITSLAEPEKQKGQMTAGISMFYFEEVSQN